jgi:hypothetical protein
MLDLLNVVGTVAIHTLTITMQVVTPIPMGKQLNEVTPVELKRGGLLVENCRFGCWSASSRPATSFGYRR